MLRVATLALVLGIVLVTPLGQAAQGVDASVAVGPRGLAEDGTPYYLRATLTDPELPRDANDGDDCAAQERPHDVEHVAATADRILAWDPLTEFRVSGWYPTCVAAAAPVGYASYDARTGRYYIEASTPVMDGVGAALDALGVRDPAHAAFAARLSGTTGLGTEADCEYCPPPTG